MIVKYSKVLTRALFVLAASAAPAADLPYMKPSFAFEPPPPAFTWTGLYSGLNAGGAVGAGVGAGVYADKSPSGAVGGGQVGFNYQLSPRFVIGAENDFQASILKARHDSPYHRDATLAWFGTARGRVGFALTAELTQWATSPRFVYRHEWSVSDLRIWDNAGTMHRVTPYDAESGGLMTRTTIAGEEPLA